MMIGGMRRRDVPSRLAGSDLFALSLGDMLDDAVAAAIVLKWWNDVGQVTAQGGVSLARNHQAFLSDSPHRKIGSEARGATLAGSGWLERAQHRERGCESEQAMGCWHSRASTRRIA